MPLTICLRGEFLEIHQKDLWSNCATVRFDWLWFFTQKMITKWDILIPPSGWPHFPVAAFDAKSPDLKFQIDGHDRWNWIEISLLVCVIHSSIEGFCVSADSVVTRSFDMQLAMIRHLTNWSRIEGKTYRGECERMNAHKKSVRSHRKGQERRKGEEIIDKIN